MGVEPDDERRYLELQLRNEKAWEALCGRCGACCGTADGDPCEHLKTGADRKYYCAIYADRFGLRKTVSGKTITCVPIRNILHKSWPGDDCCGYKLMMKKAKGGSNG